MKLDLERSALQNIYQKKFQKTFLIEKDNNLATQLKLKYEKIKNIFIINDDALTFDYSIFKRKEKKLSFMATYHLIFQQIF